MPLVRLAVVNGIGFPAISKYSAPVRTDCCHDLKAVAYISRRNYIEFGMSDDEALPQGRIRKMDPFGGQGGARNIFGIERRMLEESSGTYLRDSH
jgi:hypothetical protein